MVIWDKGVFNFDSYTSCDYFLAIRGKWKKSGLESTIVNVYGPHNDRGKKLMWESLDVLLNSVSLAWLLCGDFNEVRNTSDRLNSQFHQGRADRFNDFILRNNLIEIPISGRKFTRISDDGVKFSKLDRFLVTDNFLGLWEDLSIITLDRNLSDHCLLVLRDRIFDYGPKPFKVFDEWFNCLDVGDVIRDAWNQPIRGSKKDCVFRDRLKNVKMTLRTWSKSKFGGLHNEINELKKEALNGVWIDEPNAAKDIVLSLPKIVCLCEFFQARFIGGPHPVGPSNRDPSVQNNQMGVSGSRIEPSCFIPSESEAMELKFRFTDDEIWGAVNECTSNKAPGPDSRKKSMIFKVDFEKAFDSLNWEFLDNMLRLMGFGSNWRGWIASCLKTAFISILVNGSPTREFKIGRGVRQGDPLSPFLFIIAAEGLSWLIKSAVSNNLYCGVEIGKDKILISHLQYADDTIFFGK
ncbi:uncharacterized protein [Rutidosis leptorrhynchoides]|uniref:uncharacterized protein n=1 Tax=Rutidosis leptorrhynchoides TaxID=125765 RepID=UPI003A992F37